MDIYGLQISQGVVRAILVTLVTIAVTVAVRFALLRSLARDEPPRYRVRQLARMVSVSLVVIGLLVALQLSDLDIRPLLGAVGIGGIAVAIAAQDILQNLLAGFLIQLRRPFRAGEQIKSDDFEGTVTDIDLRAVHMRTYDGLDVVIPSADVLRSPIVNNTRTAQRRTTLTVGVDYRTDLRLAQQVLVEACKSIDGVSTLPTPEALVEEFADSSINFALRYWHKSDVATLWRVRSAVAIAVKDALDTAEITIPFPQRVLWDGKDQ